MTASKGKTRPVWGRIAFFHGESPEGYLLEVEGEERTLVRVSLDPVEENPIAVGGWLSGFGIEVGGIVWLPRWKAVPAEVKDPLPMEDPPPEQGILYLTALGFPARVATLLYEAWGPGAGVYLRARPYAPAEEGYISLDELDRLYLSRGLPRLHPCRTKGLALFYLEHIAAAYGHTALDFPALLRFVRNEERLEAVMAGIGLLLEEGSVEAIREKVALKKFYNLEKEIAEFFTQNVGKEEMPLPAGIASIASRLNEGQRQALSKAFAHGRLAVLGGPGTGKTTLLRSLVQAWEEAGVSYRLLSPTGKGAKRISEATGRESSTVHRILFSRNFPKAKAVVIDEAGLLPSPVLGALLRRMDPRTRVVLLGDPNQLPPVGPGSPFADLLRHVPSAELKQFMRQESQDLIEGARLALEGKDPIVALGEENAIPFEEEPPLERVWALWRENPETQILVPWKPRPFGADHINEFFVRKLGKGDWFPGMSLIGLKNSPSINVWNGEVYKIAKADQTEIQLDSGTALTREEAKKILAPAFAITVHRAQGSEWEEVLLVLPNAYPSLLSRKLLYTAITRAKKRFRLFYDLNALRKLLESEEEERSTVLKLLLP